MTKDYHALIQIWSECKVVRENRIEFTSIEKADEFLRLANILALMVNEVRENRIEFTSIEKADVFLRLMLMMILKEFEIKNLNQGAGGGSAGATGGGGGGSVSSTGIINEKIS